MRRVLHLLTALAALTLAFPAFPRAEGTPLTDPQLLRLYFADSGRSFGYQVMIARIHLDTVRTELARDEAILRRNETLHTRSALALIDLQVSQLKDAWNRKQLIVAEENLEFLSAEYAAMTRISEHYAGATVTVEELYAIFRRGWEAGCAKGPDEVAAYQAWTAYAEKSLERARQLNRRGNLSESEVLEREAQLAIATSNYQNRLAGLDRCRTVLFPSLEDILKPAP